MEEFENIQMYVYKSELTSISLLENSSYFKRRMQFNLLHKI